MKDLRPAFSLVMALPIKRMIEGICDMANTADHHDDLPAHVDSYGRFLSWFRNGAIAVAIIVAAVIFIITR